MNLSYLSLCDVFQGDRKANLTTKLIEQHRWSETKANRAVEDYIMFLYVASLNVGVHLVPTQDIDCVWEADILQSTAQYIQTCQTLCGQVIHHAGTTDRQQPPNVAGSKAAFAKTQKLFEQYFDNISLKGVPAACGVLSSSA